jgi:uncharacterized protein
VPYFLCRLLPPRKTFLIDMTSEESELMRAHRSYWRPFVETGVVMAMGPVADPAGGWGLAILEAASLEAAKELEASDPVTLANRGFAYETHPMPALSIRPAEPRAPVSSISP